LKNWWDNFLDPETRVKILNHTYKSIDYKGKEVDEEDGQKYSSIPSHFISLETQKKNKLPPKQSLSTLDVLP